MNRVTEHLPKAACSPKVELEKNVLSLDFKALARDPVTINDLWDPAVAPPLLALVEND